MLGAVLDIAFVGALVLILIVAYWHACLVADQVREASERVTEAVVSALAANESLPPANNSMPSGDEIVGAADAALATIAWVVPTFVLGVALARALHTRER